MTLRINGQEGDTIYADEVGKLYTVLLDDSHLARVGMYLQDGEGNVVFPLDGRIFVAQSIDLVFD